MAQGPLGIAPAQQREPEGLVGPPDLPGLCRRVDRRPGERMDERGYGKQPDQSSVLGRLEAQRVDPEALECAPDHLGVADGLTRHGDNGESCRGFEVLEALGVAVLNGCRDRQGGRQRGATRQDLGRQQAIDVTQGERDPAEGLGHSLSCAPGHRG